MSETGTYDTEVNQGDTFRRRFTWYDENDDLVDLTGWSARMQLRLTVDAEEFVLELTTDNGGITLGGEEGTVALYADAETMALIDAGSYRYDLELIAGALDSDADVRKLLRGKIKVVGEVTR